MLTEAPPEGVWEGDATPERTVGGMLRDLDASLSFAMKEVELGLVEQVDTPDPASARKAGQRVYRLITMRDLPVWVRVSWQGVGADAGELRAARTEQAMVVRVKVGRDLDGGGGGGDAEDRAYEKRVLTAFTDRIRENVRKEKSRGESRG